MYKSPQIFHDKEDKPKVFVMYPSELLSAINNLLSGNEAKVLLVLLGCKGDGSFSPSAEYMQKMTGITQSNNYYKTRKQLHRRKRQHLHRHPKDNIQSKREREKPRRRKGAFGKRTVAKQSESYTSRRRAYEA